MELQGCVMSTGKDDLPVIVKATCLQYHVSMQIYIYCMDYSISTRIPFAITTYVIPNGNLQHGTGVTLISQHWMEGPTHSMDGESTYCYNTPHQKMELPSVCRHEWSLWTGHLLHSFQPWRFETNIMDPLLRFVDNNFHHIINTASLHF